MSAEEKIQFILTKQEEKFNAERDLEEMESRKVVMSLRRDLLNAGIDPTAISIERDFVPILAKKGILDINQQSI